MTRFVLIYNKTFKTIARIIEFFNSLPESKTKIEIFEQRAIRKSIQWKQENC